jgi:hypothetical protein
LRAERGTPPRLLPLWIVALIALAGHVPGSTTWALTAIGTLVLGLAVAPIMGSIRPTVVAYGWLLATITVLSVAMLRMPLGAAYDKAWLDQGSTGLLAMILLGGIMVGAFTSIVWAVLVLTEAARRFSRRRRAGRLADRAPDAPIPVSVEPASSARARRWANAWRRVFIAIVCLALAVPLPSFFELSGLHAAAMRSPHSGLTDAIGGTLEAAVWPILSTAWLALGAGIGWLVWMRTPRAWRIGGIATGVALLILVLLTSASFGIVPGASAAQRFSSDVLDACPAPSAAPCPPAWLFDAPRLAEVTATAAAWCSLLLALGTATLALTWWRRRSRVGKVSAPQP